MKTKVWQRSLGAWALIPVLYLAVLSNANIAWWVVAFGLYLTIALTVTVGYHRLFTHNSFECPKFWRWFFGIVGSVSLNTSPVQWSAVHIAHHRHTDTDRDPYDSNIKHYLRFKERTDIPPTKNEIRMLKDPMHQFLLNNSLTLCVAFAILMFAISYEAFLFLWALPTSLYLVTAGLHTIFAHSGRLVEGDERRSTARNLWLLEFIVPMGGEWLHKEHHDKPGLADWGTKPIYYDMGAQLIRMISTNGKQPT